MESAGTSRASWCRGRMLRVGALSLVLATTLAATVGTPTIATAQAFGGLELALHGADSATPGRPWRVAGQAFEVRGLARLRPLPRGEIEARWLGDADDAPIGASTRVIAGSDGRFVLEVPIPAGAHGAGHVELVLTDADEHERKFEVPIGLSAAEQITFHTDRRFYQPGEPMHLWALVRDARDGRPLPGRVVELAVGSVLEPREVRTDASGVAHVQITLPDEDVLIHTEANARLLVPMGPRAALPISIGRRTSERLLVELRGVDFEVAPAAAFSPSVHVTTTSGAPVPGAQVTLTVSGLEPIVGTTDREGIARFEARAPAYLSGDTGAVGVLAQVEHAAHGSARASGRVTLAVPLALELEVVAESGALVPEVASGLLLRVTDARGEPSVDARVHVRGPGLSREGLSRAEVEVRTDRHGLARVEATVPAHAVAALHDGSCGEGRGAIFDVRVEGPRDRVARRCVPVHESSVRVRVEPAVAAPGESLEVRVDRRPHARSWPVAIVVRDARGELVGFEVLTPGRDRTRFDAPRVHGIAQVEARPIDPNGTTTLGVPFVDVALIRPSAPAFPRLSSDAPVHAVGGEATLTIADAPEGWVALDVRDLAQHGGERPFVSYFLNRAFERAVLDPSTPDAERLLRAALVEHSPQTTLDLTIAPVVDVFGRAMETDHHAESWAQTLGDLRDPRPDALELVRRGLFDTYRALEAGIAEGTVSLTGEGTRRRFADEALEELGLGLETIGGEPATLAAALDADSSFTFERAARRVARARLVRVLATLAAALSEDVLEEQPPERWLSILVRSGRLAAEDLRDPWDHVLGLRARPSQVPALAVELAGRAFAFPGPDGRLGTNDDILDPFAREVPAGTPYAIASGEDELQRQLALLAPGPAALRAMLEAFERITRAMYAAQIGDAATADATQGFADSTLFEGHGGLGLSGSGMGGGGSGSGSGHGYGSGRGARAPQIRTGMAAAAAMGSLRGLIREDLPATLRFFPSIVLDGATQVRIPLADAATTYLVEAIHWREDGWSWSARTELRVDREVVVDAPVPDGATVGDVLELPIRVRSQGVARTLRLFTRGEEGIAFDALEAGEVRVPADDARALLARVPLTRAGRGRVVVAAFEGDTPRDALARTMEVLPAGRLQTLAIDSLVPVGGELAWTVPEGASWRRPATLRVSLASSVLMRDATGWAAWARRLRGLTIDAEELRRHRERIRSGQLTNALAFGLLWQDGETDDATLLEALSVLTPADGTTANEVEALVLLALAPAHRALNVRPRVAPALARLVGTLRGRLEDEVALSSSSPAFHAAAAAALAWVGERRSAREADRRATRHLATFGDETWLQTYSEAAGSQNVASTALLALARIADERPLDAFPLVRTLTRWAFETSTTPPRRAGFGSVATELSMAAFAFDAPTARRAVRVEVDGTVRDVPLENGRGTLVLPELAPGDHWVRLVDGPRDGAVHLQVEGELRRPWRDERGPVALRWRVPRTDGTLDPAEPEDDARARVRARRDGRDELVLEVRNRTPRTFPGVVVLVQLPAGAELDEPALARLRSQGRTALVSGGVLTIHLPALLPSRSTRVPLGLRWSVGGRLGALGTAAWPIDRADTVTALPPITLEVRSPEAP